MNNRIPILVFFLLLSFFSMAQENYFVNRKTVSLNKEVQGHLELLWNDFDEENRYFLKKGNHIIELRNSERNGQFREEYKKALEKHTADVEISVNNVDLTLPSLREFFNAYNGLTTQENTLPSDGKKQVELRIGAFGGATNSIFTENISNESQAFIGLELELVDLVMLKRHSIVLDFKNTFEGNEHKYTMSQLGLNYRLKFINSERFSMYVNTKFVALTSFKTERPSIADNNIIVATSGSIFNTPVSFGVGADIKLGNSYVTVGYHDFYSLTMTSNNQFPIDFSIGYKFSI